MTIPDPHLERRLQKVFEHHEQGEFDLAVHLYRELIHQYPDIWQLYFNFGLLLFENGQLEEALELYLDGAAINDTSIDLLYNMAICQKALGLIDQAIETYNQALALGPEEIDCRYNLAGCYMDIAEEEKAESLYRTILESNPDHLPSLNNLAYLTHRLGRAAAARDLYAKILKLEPAHVFAGYMLAALTGEPKNQPPDLYIKNLFDQFAGHYDSWLRDKLHYDLPSVLHEFYTALVPDRIEGRLLDLGCGTGLAGEQFHTLCQSMDGVDISDKMIAVARLKNHYENLYTSEIITFLDQRSPGVYTLTVCADVLPYVGDLKQLFQAVTKVMTAEGHFLFSVEHDDAENNRPALHHSGRFAHSRHYISNTAGRTGWKIIGEKQCELRQERQDWVNGCLYLMIQNSA